LEAGIIHLCANIVAARKKSCCTGAAAACKWIKDDFAQEMVAAKVDIKTAQQRLGHSRPTTLLIHYAQVLDEPAGLLRGQLSKIIPAEFGVNPVAV
jgi:hypothetical protein